MDSGTTLRAGPVFMYADLWLEGGWILMNNDLEWYKSLSKVLRKIKGASYTINAEEGMAYITGRADPRKLLRMLKSDKYADICWVKTGNHIIYGANTGPGTMMEQPPPAAYSWHNHYPPPPRHHMLPYDQQQRLSIAYPYNDYPQSGYW
ncbi:hypothetical protein Dsin_023327 [Dipteronia sinensis]|uniref:Uncharacterized protein n=1 Tax=Dipteronia sinensis TaxID=43782 RepID=A0AAE0A438_9ROSI|nr:hypothetical protein Dsin_023327 [Dipteronia sinensis]